MAYDEIENLNDELEFESLEDSVVDEIWSEVEIENPKWSAPLIFAKELWKPVMKAILNIFNQPSRKRADNLCVYGNTDTGKTTCFDKIIPSFQRMKKLHGYEIVQVTCFTNMTVAGFYKAILDKINFNYRRSDNIADLERRLTNALVEKGVKILIFDEFSNISFMNSQERNLFLKALRNIPTHTKIPIIVIGTQRVLDLLSEDSETNNRYEKIEFPRFSLANGKWKELQLIIATLDSYLLETTKIVSDFSTNGKLIEKLYLESKGKMGSIIKIYERVVHITIEGGYKKLSENLLDKAIAILNKNNRLHDDENGLLDMEFPNDWANS